MFIVIRYSEFWNQNSNFSFFQQRNSKKNLTRIFGIENGMGILLLMGVPEIRTKNWDYQPSWSVSLLVVLSVRLLVGRSVGQSVSWSVGQSVSRSVGQLVSQSVDQSVSW